jgi:hypothetical protein
LSPRSLKPEEKVDATIQMTDAMVKICADGIRDQNLNMPEEQMQEELRKRINSRKRSHHEV